MRRAILECLNSSLEHAVTEQTEQLAPSYRDIQTEWWSRLPNPTTISLAHDR